MRAPAPLPTDPVPRRTILTPIGSVIANGYLVVATLFFGSLAAVIGWLPPRGFWMYQLARMWSWGWLIFAGIRLRIFDRPPRELGGAIYMSNHQSYFDIPTLIGTLPGQTRFLAKRMLFKIPIFGWALYAGGFIPVDRGDRQAARNTYAAALKTLEKGHSILIFPEETRSADGKLKRFKRGGAVMALETGFPIVPVGLRGTRQVQPRDRWTVTPGRVEIRYGEPIDPGAFDGDDPHALLDRVRAEIAALAGLADDDAPEATRR
ncbi:MAG: lysophospholipid acyltransferase family protein [Acidobacteriota bacterium]